MNFSVLCHTSLLRTALNVIKGYTELVEQKVLGQINSKQENALGKILEQSMDLLDTGVGIPPAFLRIGYLN